ncbi:MAG TPA: Holliday junction branch migration protein RuvA [Candidatus Acidoferrales bacterium]|nr:Holliday junction branch migration protein RuvA [Candidatus Acidoferrales bacterium]
MIGCLRGEVIEVAPPLLVIDVAGVGYEVEVPVGLLEAAELGQVALLWTHLIPREDALQLYGFGHRAERALFRELLRVNGVGAKLALALLSAMPAAHLQDCLMRGDVAALTRVSGVGRKTAERLVMELRDRVGAVPLTPLAGDSGTTPLPRGAFDEAYAALVALGYRANEARDLLQSLDPAITDSETLIRLALRSAFQ